MDAFPQTAQEQCQIVKPAIKPAMLLMQSFLHAVIPFMVAGWFLGGFVAVLVAIVAPGSFVFVVIGMIVCFLIFWWCVYLFRRATLRNTEYKFYANRVEYYEGFLVKNRKSISYDRISNVGQQRGIIERMFGLGTVYLDTPGSSTAGHELAMSYLENPDQMYDWVVRTTAKKQ